MTSATNKKALRSFIYILPVLGVASVIALIGMGVSMATGPTTVPYTPPVLACPA